MMQDYNYEIDYLSAAAAELETYLLSKEVYWNLGLRPARGAAPYPRFSLGWLLLYMQRIRLASPTDSLTEILALIARTESHWRSAWQRKAETEYAYRLKLWTDFMNELRQDPGAHRDRYAYEVQRRTMLTLLAAEAEDLPAAQVQLLRSMDAFLRENLKPGPFVDQPQYQAGFPKDEYWYLYGSPA